MNANDSSVYRQEPSTKIKLRFDNSQLKIDEAPAPEPAPLHGNLTNSSHVPRLGKRPEHITPFDYNHINAEEDFYMQALYMENMASYNRSLMINREKLENLRNQFGVSRPVLSGTITSINASQIPVFIRTSDGEVYYGSNDKIEPQITHVSNFVNLNVKNEHMGASSEKGSFHTFAPRRRRRGTGKLVKH